MDGYDIINHKAQINEEQANIVCEMFNDYLSGMRLKDIAEKFQANGIKNKYDKSFTINSISRILRNPNYKGEVYADDTVYANIFPAIVEKELWDNVNARLQVGKRTSAHFKGQVNYLLSGKLFCGKCGGLMTGDSGKGKMGNIYHYYKCFTKKKNKNICDKKSIKKDYIEENIVFATQEFMQRTDLKAISVKIAKVYNKSIEEDNVLKSLEKELQENNKKLKNLLTALENGIFNDTTNQRMQELELNKKELSTKIAERSSITIPKLEEEQVYAFAVIQRPRLLVRKCKTKTC